MTKLKVKALFFDRELVRRKMNQATRRALSKAGAFIRQRARTSMRRRKRGASPAGQPPFSHAGQLRDLLYFAADPGFKTVVVGPVRFKKGEAPPLNEFGGTVERRTRRGKVLLQTYPARPFMAPALEAERPNLPKRWANSVKGGL